MRVASIALGSLVFLACGSNGTSGPTGSSTGGPASSHSGTSGASSTAASGGSTSTSSGAGSSGTHSSGQSQGQTSSSTTGTLADASAGDATSPDGSVPATAAGLVAQWTLGWNLGNSLDANGCGATDETCWGNPASNQALFNYVASLGFKVVRIPVTWYEHLGPAPTYTIDPTWLSRVDTVVSYALQAGLYAVVNIHHDGADSSTAQWLNPSTTDQAGVTAEFTAIWTQIANHFKSFDNRLVFESMNEIHHGYATPDPSWTTFVNSLNQAFVTTVRGTGGNNASRFLDVPGYNTNIDITVASFSLPTDTISNHLIVTYHYYDPSSFTISSTTHQWGAAFTGSDPCCNETYVTTELNKMQTTFIAKGIPVMMGEYSATYQAGYEDFRRYWTEYVTKAAHDRGIAPFYWDAGQDLIDRTHDAVLYSDVMSAMTRAATSSYTLSQIAPPQ